MQKKFNTPKVLLALLSVFILILTQVIANLVGGIFFDIPNMEWLGDILSCIVYIASAVILIQLLCEKVLRVKLSDCRIGTIKIKPIWVISGLALPLLVSFVFVLMPGELVRNKLDGISILSKITTALLYYGVSAGIVEEIVFRGVIMTALEKRWNKIVAILVPSMAFGLIHAIGGDFSPSSILILFIAGTAVGILFSLVVYESGSIWNSAFMHAAWNCIIIGGILTIGSTHNPTSIYSYSLNANSMFITGGDFGIEASIVSICGYILFSLLAIIYIKKRKKV